MDPREFEHVVAAAAEVTDQDELVVIGSQAILGSFERPPESMLRSLEVDIYPLHDPGTANFIDGSLVESPVSDLVGGESARTLGLVADAERQDVEGQCRRVQPVIEKRQSGV